MTRATAERVGEQGAPQSVLPAKECCVPSATTPARLRALLARSAGVGFDGLGRRRRKFLLPTRRCRQTMPATDQQLQFLLEARGSAHNFSGRAQRTRHQQCCTPHPAPLALRLLRVSMLPPGRPNTRPRPPAWDPCPWTRPRCAAAHAGVLLSTRDYEHGQADGRSQRHDAAAKG